MTLRCSLLSQSVKYDRDTFGATAVYHIYDDAAAAITVGDITNSSTVAAVLGNSGSAISSFGDWLAGTGTYAGYRKLRYAGYDLKNDEGQFHWTLTVNFDSAASDASPTAAAQDVIPENAPGFTAIEMNIEAVTLPTWRVNATIPTSTADVNNPPQNDIGGKPIDQAGEPLDAFITIAKFTIRNVIRGRPGNSIIQAIANQTNTRNDSVLQIGSGTSGFSCSVGSLLFLGAQVSRCGPNAYEVTYNLAYDEDCHLRQIAATDEQGKPRLGVYVPASNTITNDPTTMDSMDSAAVASTGHNAPRCSKTVMWKQPFPALSNFNNLGMTGLT